LSTIFEKAKKTELIELLSYVFKNFKNGNSLWPESLGARFLKSVKGQTDINHGVVWNKFRIG
jgi:hypothetical protein